MSDYNSHNSMDTSFLSIDGYPQSPFTIASLGIDESSKMSESPGSTVEESTSIYLKTIIGIFLVLVILISIFGNLLVCVAIASDRRLRRLGNLFLVSLAIADLCVGALVMTFALANDLMGYWPFWPQLCEIWIAFDISCSTCSIVNLCAIALDRFAHIKDPMLYNRWINKRIVVASVSIIWLLSGLISFLPISLGWHKPIPSQQSSILQSLNHQNQQNNFSTTPTVMTIIMADDQSKSVKNALELLMVVDNQQKRFRKRSVLEDLQGQWSSKHPIFSSPIFRRRMNISMITKDAIINHSPSFYLPSPIFPDEEERGKTDPDENDQKQEVINMVENQQPYLRHFKHYSTSSSYSSPSQQIIENLFQQKQPEETKLSKIEPEIDSSSLDQKWLQCTLDLTPTYAVISSCISFYFPCLIMLCLYARLYSICQQHVKSIKSMTKMVTLYSGDSGVSQQKVPNLSSVGGLRTTKTTNNHNNNVVSNQPSIGSNSSTLYHHPYPYHHPNNQQQSHVSEHKAAITLGIIMGTFLACWMPFFCMNIVAAFCKTCIPASVFKVLTWLGYFNSCLNPAIYSIFNTEFRDAFRRILMRCLFNSEMSQACNRICRPCKNSTTGRTKSSCTISYDQETSIPSCNRNLNKKDQEYSHLQITKTNSLAVSSASIDVKLSSKDDHSEGTSTIIQRSGSPTKITDTNLSKFTSESQNTPNQNQRERHQNLHLCNSYSFDHSMISSKNPTMMMTRMVQQPKQIKSNTESHHIPQMSSDPNLTTTMTKPGVTVNNYHKNKNSYSRRYHSSDCQSSNQLPKESFNL